MIIRSTTKPFKHVWSLDPALDRENEKFEEHWRKFLKSGDVASLPLRDGQRPTVFTLIPLNRGLFLRLEKLDGLTSHHEIVAYALKAVDGFEVDGIPVKLDEKDAGGFKRLTDECLDKLYDPNLFAALSVRVLEVSRLDPTSGQGS